MSANLDKPLDDLVASNREARRSQGRGGGSYRGRGRAGGPMRSNRNQGNYRSNPYRKDDQPMPERPNIEDTWKHDLYGSEDSQQAPRAAGQGFRKRNQEPIHKIKISNLKWDVTEGDLKELFEAKVGVVKNTEIEYDESGRSKGIAYVGFATMDDAQKAKDMFDGKAIDQQPMSIEFIGTTVDRRDSGGRGRGRGGWNRVSGRDNDRGSSGYSRSSRGGYQRQAPRRDDSDRVYDRDRDGGGRSSAKLPPSAESIKVHVSL